MSRYLALSSFSVKAVLVFLTFSLIARIIFPFGDEPDFSVRAPEMAGIISYLSKVSHHWIQTTIIQLEVQTNCQIVSGPFLTWAKIDYKSCYQPVEQVLLRWSLLCLLASPILSSIVFRNIFVAFAGSCGIRLNELEWKDRLDTVSIAILFPSMIYYLGVLSVEQITLLLSILLFLVFESWLLSILLLLFMLLIDYGNGLVVLFFFLLTKLYATLFRRSSGIRPMLLVSIFLIAGAYTAGFTLLQQIEDIPFLREKSEAIHYSLENSDKAAKYPVVLRPIVTFMSFVFLTPSFVKSVPTYVLCGIATIWGGGGLWKYYRQSTGEIISKRNPVYSTEGKLDPYLIKLTCAITTILCFVFLLPTYANAKYYIFLLPFIIMNFLRVYEREYILIFAILCSFTVFLNVVLYTVS